jgi:hypothetical protein
MNDTRIVTDTEWAGRAIDALLKEGIVFKAKGLRDFRLNLMGMVIQVDEKDINKLDEILKETELGW